jgi:ubiquinone/menaquinone biosynthesis C-methylase UbiE
MTEISQLSKRTYQSKSIVELYSKAHDLQTAEKSILELLKNDLSSMRMLDIGIGGGRTTFHFAPLVKEYLGIDFSSHMIEACHKRFKDQQLNLSCADAKDLTSFPKDSFDFILFSFNGIDYMNHSNRLKALKEIRRVTKPEGYFSFSSHNINSIERFLHVSFCRNPIRLMQIYSRAREIKSLIREYQSLDKIPYAILNDGGEEFRLKTYYINPLEQLRQLQQVGFQDIKIFSHLTGQEIQKHKELNLNTKDPWLYYLCQVKS